MKIHHIAYAVTDIDEARSAFTDLGYREAVGFSRENDEKRKVEILFLANEQGNLIELVAPLSEDSPISKILKKESGSATPYHICFETDSLDEAIRSLRSKGFFLIEEKAPAPAIHDNDVAFLFKRGCGIIELVSIA